MMPRRTCYELGICQARPGCTCCTPDAAQIDTTTLSPGGFYFAPGAIEHAPRGRRLRLPSDWVERVARAVLVVASCVALVAAIGFSAGLLTVRGLL